MFVASLATRDPNSVSRGFPHSNGLLLFDQFLFNLRDHVAEFFVGFHPLFNCANAVHHCCVIAAAELLAERLQTLPGEFAAQVNCNAAGEHNLPPTRSLVDKAYRVVRWTDHAAGGHFPGYDIPGPLSEDIAAFAASCEGAG